MYIPVKDKQRLKYSQYKKKIIIISITIYFSLLYLHVNQQDRALLLTEYDQITNSFDSP